MTARRLQRRQRVVHRRRLALGIVAGLIVVVAVLLVSQLDGNLTVARLQADEQNMFNGAHVSTSATNLLVLGSDGRDTSEGMLFHRVDLGIAGGAVTLLP